MIPSVKNTKYAIKESVSARKDTTRVRKDTVFVKVSTVQECIQYRYYRPLDPSITSRRFEDKFSAKY